MNKPLVIYHADCTDGFGAAFAAWLKLGDEAEYLPMQYYQEIKSKDGWVGRNVFVLDFSFDFATTATLMAGTNRFVWLDHHKSAFERWTGHYNAGMKHTDVQGSHHIVLDDNKSGALLAWEYFHPGTEAPALIRHIDDRDRWQFKLEGSKELHAGLSLCRPWSFAQWEGIFGNPTTGFPKSGVNVLRSEGSTALRAQEVNVNSMAKQARKCNINLPTRVDLCGLAVNACIHQSEVGHELANQSGSYGLVYYVGPDNRVRCSLRSNGDYDVSAIAKAFGGGGHRNAAGFDTDIETLMGWLK